MDILFSYSLVKAAACETECEQASLFIWMEGGAISIGNASESLSSTSGSLLMVALAASSSAIANSRLAGIGW